MKIQAASDPLKVHIINLNLKLPSFLVLRSFSRIAKHSTLFTVSQVKQDQKDDERFFVNYKSTQKELDKLKNPEQNLSQKLSTNLHTQTTRLLSSYCDENSPSVEN